MCEPCNTQHRPMAEVGGGLWEHDSQLTGLFSGKTGGREAGFTRISLPTSPSHDNDDSYSTYLR